MKEEHYTNPKCQECGNCCKQVGLYTDLKDDAIRFSWLDTDKITVTKVKEGLWKLMFHYPCVMLEEKDGLFYCKRHKGQTPGYCKTYPLNFKGDGEEVIDEERKICPIIKEVVE